LSTLAKISQREISFPAFSSGPKKLFTLNGGNFPLRKPDWHIAC
jgi:hypothetical protein